MSTSDETLVADLALVGGDSDGEPYRRLAKAVPQLLVERDETRAALAGQGQTISRLRIVARYAGLVMETLEAHGPGIVGHLLDTDDNDGQRLREALRAACLTDVPEPPQDDMIKPNEFRVTVETTWGALRPQTVSADNLVDALTAAIAIPFPDWFDPEHDEDEHR